MTSHTESIPFGLRMALSHVTRPFRSWSVSSARYPLGYMPALDGIRGFMTIVVLAAHTRLDIVRGAELYMDVFFVMSGHLITSLLISDYLKNGRLDLKKFYYRRFTRLYQALSAMLICLIGASLIFSKDLMPRLVEAVVGMLYATNYYAIFSINTHYVQHLWSLSVEQQFYVLWPLLFAMLLRFRGLSHTTMWIVLAIAAVISMVRIYLNYRGFSIVHLFVAFHTRADSLLLGCALAIALRLAGKAQPRRLSYALSGALLPVFALSLVGIFSLDHMARSYFYIWSLVAALGGAVVVASIVQPRSTVGRRFFECAPLIFVGRICYGLYIWHWPVFAFLLHDGNQEPFWPRALAAWTLSFGLAMASYLLLEQRFMSTREISRTA